MDGNLLLMFLVFFPFAAGLVSYIIGRGSKGDRDAFVIIVTAVEFVASLALIASSNRYDFHWHGFAGLGLHFRGDGFRLVMAVLAGFIWFFTTIMSREYFNKLESRNRNRYYMFMLWTLGATMGIFLSTNLYTTFIFFEIMSFTSYVLVIHNETKEAIEAAKSYVGFAVFGGLATLMGLFMLQANLGTLDMDHMLDAIVTMAPTSPTLMWACILVLIGFGVKSGMYPLHTWLPKSYVNAPEPATALLSTILSKCGIFGIFVITGQILLHDFTWGMIMLCLGVLTMLTGAMLAVVSTNFKRTLACSSMSQIGFILVGIGMQGILGDHNAIAVSGSILHLVNHSLIKLVLFMIAGVIFMNMRNFDLNEIRGFGRKKWLIKIMAAFAILGVAGVPLFNGYISKTLIHESIVEYIAMFPSLTGMAVFFKIVEALFTFTGGLTFCYMLKIFIAIFIEKNNDAAKQEEMDGMKTYMKWPMATIITISAIILPIIGVLPHLTQDKIADIAKGFLHGHGLEPVHYFSAVNLRGAGVSLAIGAIFYFLIVRVCLMKKTEDGHSLYVNIWNSKVDIEDKFYRPALLTILPFIGSMIARTAYSIVDWLIALFQRIFFYKRPERFNPPLDNEFGTFNEPAKDTRLPRGISYTLLLFVVGLVAVLYFVMIVFFAK